MNDGLLWGNLNEGWLCIWYVVFKKYMDILINLFINNTTKPL